MTLYNARTTPDGLRITKFDALGNVESTYLTSEEACECPAGVRSSCRHRFMLPNLRPIADTHWFYDYDRHDIVDLNGMTKATFDRIEARQALRPQGVPTPSEPATDENGCYTLPNGDCVSPGPCMHTEPATTPLTTSLPPAPARMRR